MYKKDYSLYYTLVLIFLGILGVITVAFSGCAGWYHEIDGVQIYYSFSGRLVVAFLNLLVYGGILYFLYDRWLKIK